MKKILFSIITIFLSFSIIGQVQNNNIKRYQDINKNLEIFSNTIKELDMFYVDSIPVDSIMKKTIAIMLSQFDPYTVYIPEEDMTDFRLMTTGEYAGIGSIISYHDSCVIINEPYKGLPAQKSGLMAGDVILEIDGKDMRKADVKTVSDNLRGVPGSTLAITIKRPYEDKEKVVKVVREKININPVTYAGIINGNVGYIYFSSFTKNGSEEVRKALIDLKKKGAESIILDLRGNSGGILEDAIEIVNLFVPKDKLILSTKGKVEKWNSEYKSMREPIDTEIPLAVLINDGSASSSEIVAGALQDLDRAVVIGSRSFGKGLVQTTRELPYGGTLKVTTSKYYIPSGRCIQALDYSHRNNDGSVSHVPDSIAGTFKTAKGRVVKGGGGIAPDINLKDSINGTISFYLLQQNIIFDYATKWKHQHKKIAPIDSFKLSDNDYKDFMNFVKSKKFVYDRMSEKRMKALKEVMVFEGYMKTASDEFNALEAKLTPDLDRDLNTFRDEITTLLSQEIVKRYYYKEGVVKQTLKNDKVINKSVEILRNKSEYENILKPEEDVK